MRKKGIFAEENIQYFSKYETIVNVALVLKYSIGPSMLYSFKLHIVYVRNHLIIFPVVPFILV